MNSMKARSHQLSLLWSPSPQFISSQSFGRDTALSPQAGAAPGLCVQPQPPAPSTFLEQHLTGVQARSGKGPSLPRDGAGQCCWESSCRSASGAPAQEHVAKLLPRASLGVPRQSCCSLGSWGCDSRGCLVRHCPLHVQCCKEEAVPWGKLILSKRSGQSVCTSRLSYLWCDMTGGKSSSSHLQAHCPQCTEITDFFSVSRTHFRIDTLSLK